MKAGQSIIVKGRVQGVFFRASTMVEAQKRGIRGWVKNLSDGTVAIEVFGDFHLLNELVQWCKVGPDSAVVEEVFVSEIVYQQLDRFETRHD